MILQHRNRGFAEAVEKSRQFYNLTLSDEEDQSQRGVLTHIIEAGTAWNHREIPWSPGWSWNLSASREHYFIIVGVRNGTYAGNVMSMHYSFYWHRMLLEDCRYGHAVVSWDMSFTATTSLCKWLHFYRPPTKLGKVMFSQVSVSDSVHRGEYLWYQVPSWGVGMSREKGMSRGRMGTPLDIGPGIQRDTVGKRTLRILLQCFLV